jgi:F-box/WD-40 domain protein 7
VQVLRGHQAAVRCVCFDGKLVVSGSYDYKVRVWDPFRNLNNTNSSDNSDEAATNKEDDCLLHVLEGHTNRVYSLLFDGKRVVSGSLDSTILVWDVHTGQVMHHLRGHTSLTSAMQIKGLFDFFTLD